MHDKPSWIHPDYWTGPDYPMRDGPAIPRKAAEVAHEILSARNPDVGSLDELERVGGLRWDQLDNLFQNAKRDNKELVARLFDEGKISTV